MKVCILLFLLLILLLQWTYEDHCGPAEGDVRLTGGNQGILEAYLEGQWGSVCDGSWADLNGDVICRILGYRWALYVNTSQFHDNNNFRIDELKCDGDETSILDCDYVPRSEFQYTCNYYEHIGIECYSPFTNSDCDIISEDGSCITYMYESSFVNWDDAQSICESNGGDLASISSAQVNNKFLDAVGHYTDCWIGFRNFAGNGFTWVDGSPIDYLGWHSGEPSNTAHHCTVIHGVNWYDENCLSSYRCFFCIHKAPNIRIPDVKGCDAISSSGKCFNYVEVSQEIDWEHANRLCLADDQNLASISSSQENAVMYSIADDETYRDCWIGFNDISNETSYVWEGTSAVTYTNWGYGQPDEASGDEDCAQITTNSYWYDADCCDYKQCFFCSSPVTPFGRAINSYESLEDDSILTSDTELFCVTELGEQVIWRYLDLDDLYGYNNAISSTITDSVGISKLSIDLEEPGYYSCDVTQDHGIPRTYTIALLEKGIYLVDPFGHDVGTFHVEVLRSNAKLTNSQTIYCVASTKDIQMFEWVYINADGIATTIPADTGSSKGVSALTVSITNPGSYSCEVTHKTGPKNIFTVILAPIIYTDPILGCDAITDDGNCFRYTYDNDGIDWYDAQSSCEANGGDLASISSSREDNLLFSLFTNDVSACWIGLDLEGLSHHTWIDGSPIGYAKEIDLTRRRRSVETNEDVRSRRQEGNSCFDLMEFEGFAFWNYGDCSTDAYCYFCTNKVSQFGQLFEANRYTALEDNAILTATTTLHCITEPLGTPRVIWSYVGLDGTMSTFDVPTDATTGASLLYIDIQNPGYYSCEVTLFRGDRKKYTAVLLKPSSTTIISAADTYTYTHGIDREEISLFCLSFNNSIAFENIGWRHSGSVYLPNPLDVTSLPIDSYMIDCIDTSTYITLFTVDLTTQGRPVARINEDDYYPLLPPQVNRVYVGYQEDVLLRINVYNPVQNWNTPNGPSGSTELSLSSFDENNAGLYTYHVTNWYKEQQLAMQIEILVYPFGIEIGGNFLPLDDNSILYELSDTLYHFGEAGTTTNWRRENIIGSDNPARRRRFTVSPISTFPLLGFNTGYYVCEVLNNGELINTYTVAAFDDTSEEISIVEASDSFTYTDDEDSLPLYIFCHKPDNSVPFGYIYWRELGTDQAYSNPLQISNLQIDGERRIMECLDSRTNETVLNIDLLLQGPGEVTIDVGDMQTNLMNDQLYGINYRAPDVVLSSNLVGRWTKGGSPVGDGSTITFQTFELSDEGEYFFMVTSWEKEDTATNALALKVHRFGQQITANIFEGLEDNSIITASTTLYCIDGSSDPLVKWRHVSLDGTSTNLEADTEPDTGISLLAVSIYEPGYYSCEVNENDGYTYTVGVLNTSIYTVAMPGETYTYTIGVDTDTTFLFCYHNDVPFPDIAMTDLSTSEEVTNPLEIGNLPNTGMNRAFECTYPLDQSQLFTFDVLIRGPPVIILAAGTTSYFELLSPDINRAFVNLNVPNVGMHVDTPGRWQRPDGTFVEDNSIIFPTFDTTHQGLYKFYIMNWDNEETLAMQIILTVYPFGEKIDSNTYMALEEDSLLLADTTLYCITEILGTPQVEWYYFPYDQAPIQKYPPTDPNTGVSMLSIQTNEPGYYQCIVILNNDYYLYTVSLQDPLRSTVIQDTGSFTYTKDVDRSDTSLVCHKADNSVIIFHYYWISFSEDVSNIDFFDVGGFDENGKQIFQCKDDNTGNIVLVVDILFQGPPEITLNTGTLESYSSLTPGDNRADINLLTENVVLATVLAGRWQKPNGTFVEDNFIIFSTFEIPDEGVYKFYVINWESIETLAIEIQLTVYPFGEEISLSEYNNLEDLSVLTANTTLYCITDVIDIPEVIWNYEDLEGVKTSRSAETDFFTGISSLSVTTDEVGYYSCDVTENGVSKTYTIAVMDTDVYEVVESAQSLSYTVGIDREIAFLFCHKPDNSVPFGDIGWREMDTDERKQNPINIADIPDDGNTHTMECLDALDDTPIFNVQILIQGPPVITLNTVSVVSYTLLPEDINRAYVDLLSQEVLLSVNLVGRWQLPDSSWDTESSLTFSTFQLTDQGLYKFYVADLDNMETLAIQIYLTVNQFGEKIDSTTYGILSTNSILTANTDLYCLNGVVTWSYRDLAGISTDRTGTIDSTGASVLSVEIDNPGYYSCEVTQQPDGSINRYTVAVLDTTLLQVIETSESYLYTLGVDNDIFLFCHKPDNSISSADIVWVKNNSFPLFKNPLDVFEVGNLFKYTDTYLMECLDETSLENILSVEISMQGPPVISVDTGTVETFESLASDGNTAYIIIQTQNVVMTVNNLVGKWQRPDDTHVPDNSITFLSFDESDVGVYKFYVTDWYNEQKLAIQIQLSLSATYSQGVTDLSAVTSSETSILVTWGLLAEQTTLSDEKFSVYYGHEDVEYFAGTTDKLYFNIKGLTLYFNYTIRVDLQFAYSTETYSESVYHYLILPEITEPTTILQSVAFDFYAQETVLIVVIVFLLLVIVAILVVAIIAAFLLRRHLQRSKV